MSMCSMALALFALTITSTTGEIQAPLPRDQSHKEMEMAKSKAAAPQAKGKARSGGGLSGNKVVRPDMRKPLGQKFHQKHSPAEASQLGQKMGQPAWVTPINSSGTMRRPGEPELGNAIAQNVGKGGPGKGREVLRCGTQDQHGPVARGEGPAPGGEIFPGFGGSSK
jgi:hypothetical protein